MRNVKKSWRMMKLVAPILLLLVLACTPKVGMAQTSSSPKSVAALSGTIDDSTSSNRPSVKSDPHSSATSTPDISPALAKVLADMQAEIEELKAELKRNNASATASLEPSA